MRVPLRRTTPVQAMPMVDEPVLAVGPFTAFELFLPLTLGVVATSWLGPLALLLALLATVVAPRLRYLWQNNRLVHLCWGAGLVSVLSALEWALEGRRQGRRHWPVSPFARGPVAWWRA